VLGVAFEEARIHTNNSEPDQKPASKKDTAPKSSGKRKRQEDGEGEKSADEDGVQLKSDPLAIAAGAVTTPSDPNADPLGQINGTLPNIVLADGEEKEISSQTR
jgi:hypothetical protein